MIESKINRKPKRIKAACYRFGLKYRGSMRFFAYLFLFIDITVLQSLCLWDLTGGN